MNEDHFRRLLGKYANNQASPEETEELFALIKGSDHDDALRQLLGATLEETDPILADGELWDEQFDQVLADARNRELNGNKIRYIGWRRLAIAVCALFVISAGGYLLLRQQKPQQVAQTQQRDFLPGRNQATLTLANGQKIILTRGLNGQLAQQGNIAVNVNGGNAIAYQAIGQNIPETIVTYNTLSTAKGEQSPYPLVLADGTKIWLNAASSVTFPTAFNGNERIVKITGEAYFEVVHNAAQPFKVQVADQLIEDIGTHFNIKAYTDEPALTTTLLEGAVKVSRAAQVVNLSPGQQSTVKHGNLTLVRDANTRLAMGWREGYFRFKDAGIEEFMRQLARWYDVEVVYEGQAPANFSFSGSLREDIKASQALQVLDVFKVHHRIEGKKIIITPK